MAQANEEYLKNLEEIRQARNQAETLRNQLAAEYHRLTHHESPAASALSDDRYKQGCQAMRKAITAADLALSSIDQALREMEQVTDLPDQPLD